ncbi:SdpI family protein [Corynebacterium lubricantis]|uniref:SdpI family protein n=1 Tax=Corynebacterium lubricantis TaxID=541095 RepID=UPI0003695CD6|nr:SdpI family protein [Corynebacterium lubricantis]
MTLNLIVAIVFLILAIALIVVGGMAAAGKLPGNSYIGLRVAEVRKNESTWIQAHKVAGPFWLLSGVVMLFGAAFAWIAGGWLWLLPVIAVVVAVVFVSVGANFGARAAAVVNKTIEDLENQPPEPAPAPQLDFEAMRRAASQSDNNDAPKNAPKNTDQ